MGLGLALAIAMYDFLGYYQICYLGDEVADASRTIPRSIMISVIVVALLYLVMNIGIMGVLPWREVVRSSHVVSDLMLRVHGPRAAGLATVMIIWTALASTFAALLGYSRVPYASARAGHFFRAFAHTHPTGHFPDRSLLLVSGLAMLACLADLATVIAALLASRIFIQFVGQIATVIYVRAKAVGTGCTATGCRSSRCRPWWHSPAGCSCLPLPSSRSCFTRSARWSWELRLSSRGISLRDQAIRSEMPPARLVGLSLRPGRPGLYPRTAV